MADYTRFQLRGDTKANWLSVNPILAKNEPAIETDTKRFKIGDGVSTYSQLSYGRNTSEYASLYNVTSLFPLPSGYYSHESAVLAIPVGERIKGMIITYVTASGVWYTERFIGTNVSGWTTVANWEKLPDAGDLAQLRSDLNKFKAITSLQQHLGYLYRYGNTLNKDSSSTHVIVPVKAGDVIVFKANSERNFTWCALKDYAEPSTGNISLANYFATGMTGVRVRTTTENYDTQTMTSDAKYFCFNAGTTELPLRDFPSIFTINGYDVLKDIAAHIKSIYNSIDVINGKLNTMQSSIVGCGDNMQLDKMTIISTIFESGIFGSASPGNCTSDYIDVTDKTFPYYFYTENLFSQYFTILRFYDSDKNELGRIYGGNSDYYKKIFRLDLSSNCKYVKYAKGTAGSDSFGLYKGYFENFDDSVKGIINDVEQNKIYTATNNVLWLGTSIPESAHYPAESCSKNGYNCINKSLGSSSLTFTNVHPSNVNNYSGRALTATEAELEALYRQEVTAGTISEATLENWKDHCITRAVIPYIDGTNAQQVSMIIVDHGYNDRSIITEELNTFDSWDWNSEDRATFHGAFRYLLNRIQSVNPFVKVVIGGYFTSTVFRWRDPITGFGNFVRGEEITRMQRLIAEHYNISILNVWDHTQISEYYVSNSANYISTFNSSYGTNYNRLILMRQDGTYSNGEPKYVDIIDADNNISALQLYCPDGVHPHTDLTGRTNVRLNAIYAKLIQGLI